MKTIIILATLLAGCSTNNNNNNIPTQGILALSNSEITCIDKTVPTIKVPDDLDFTPIEAYDYQVDTAFDMCVIPTSEKIANCVEDYTDSVEAPSYLSSMEAIDYRVNIANKHCEEKYL